LTEVVVVTVVPVTAVTATGSLPGESTYKENEKLF
jgi:hypothetical protein